MPAEGRDHELAGDVVGVTSARLLAAGVPRADRLGALRLLGAIAEVADDDLRVPESMAAVAAGQTFPAADAARWADALLLVGAVVVDVDEGVLVIGAREWERREGLRLHDFLDAAAEMEVRREKGDGPLPFDP